MEKSVIDRLGFCRPNRIQIAFTAPKHQKKIEREEKLNKHLIKEHQRPPQKIKTGKTPTITGWRRKIKSEKKGKKVVRRKKNILVRTRQKIKSRISHLINFARLTKRTMGWATPAREIASSTSLPHGDRHQHHHHPPHLHPVDAGKPTSPHFVIKEVKNFDPKQ